MLKTFQGILRSWVDFSCTLDLKIIILKNNKEIPVSQLFIDKLKSSRSKALFCVEKNFTLFNRSAIRESFVSLLWFSFLAFTFCTQSTISEHKNSTRVRGKKIQHFFCLAVIQCSCGFKISLKDNKIVDIFINIRKIRWDRKSVTKCKVIMRRKKL